MEPEDYVMEMFQELHDLISYCIEGLEEVLAEYEKGLVRLEAIVNPTTANKLKALSQPFMDDISENLRKSVNKFQQIWKKQIKEHVVKLNTIIESSQIPCKECRGTGEKEVPKRITEDEYSYVTLEREPCPQCEGQGYFEIPRDLSQQASILLKSFRDILDADQEKHEMKEVEREEPSLGGEYKGELSKDPLELIASIINYCNIALANLNCVDPTDDERALWSSLISLSNRTAIAKALLENNDLLELANILLKGPSEMKPKNPKLLESGIVKEIYVTDKDFTPSTIQRGEIYILRKMGRIKKIEEYLKVKYDISGNFREIVKDLLNSPIKIGLNDLEKSNIRRLIESDLCELYLIPKGYPIHSTLWFRRRGASKTKINIIKDAIFQIERITARLPETVVIHLGGHIETLRLHLNALEEKYSEPN